MAGIEVAYELRNKAAYIMASSAPVVSPGFAPIYTGSISCLLEENADLQRFAENYFHYWNLMEGDKRSATISIIKTAGLSNLANLIRQINTETSGSFLPVGNLQNYDGVLKAPFYFFDFAQYYQSLSDENTYNALQECISQCVVYKRNTPFYATEEGTFPITAFSGMTTFIMQRELNDLNEEYTKLQWYESTSMKDYLNALPSDDFRENFKNNYLIKLKNVYSLRADGSVLFNYKRLFVVATKSK